MKSKSRPNGRLNIVRNWKKIQSVMFLPLKNPLCCSETIFGAIKASLSARTLEMSLNWKLARAAGLNCSTLSAPGTFGIRQTKLEFKLGSSQLREKLQLEGIEDTLLNHKPEMLIKNFSKTIRTWSTIIIQWEYIILHLFQRGQIRKHCIIFCINQRRNNSADQIIEIQVLSEA